MICVRRAFFVLTALNFAKGSCGLKKCFIFDLSGRCLKSTFSSFIFKEKQVYSLLNLNFLVGFLFLKFGL